MTPTAQPDPESVPPWPEVDGSEAGFAVSYETLHRVSAAFDELAAEPRGGAHPDRLAESAELGDAWGQWGTAEPTRHAVEQAMNAGLSGYRQLLAELAAAGELLRRTAVAYEHADRTSGVQLSDGRSA